jgi:transposase-like protein
MDIVNQIIKQFIPQMSNEEKEELLACLVTFIDQELVDRLTEEKVEGRCPRCESKRVIKKGFKSGRQYYLCKECDRHFSSSTSKVLALSKLERDVWVEYARCMVDCLTLRECADRCGVCLKTSFFMRVRVCECMACYLDAFRVDSACTAEIDEYYLRESFTGNHTKGARFIMPRRPRRRPTDDAKRGISDNLICVLTGINDRGCVFLEIAARGRIGKEEARKILEGKVAEGAIVSTDKHQAYRKLMPELGVAIHNRYDSKDRSQGVINMVNSLHARLGDFLGRFKGISSRWLDNYLVWFQWIESFKLRHGKERADMTVNHIANGFYETRIRDCWKKPYPFGENWGLAC